MKVLVTGGAGFIGANLCSQLLEHPEVDEVRVIDDFSTGNRSNLRNLDVKLFEGSILDESLLAQASSGVSAIVHLAALGSVPRSVADPLSSHHANATGTLKVLEAARRQENALVVLASSSSVYGANPKLPKREDMACMPMSPYAVSKLATEQYAMSYARCYGLNILPFRFFNVYGPLQRADHAYAAVIPAFLAAALNGRPIPVQGDGLQSRDFTYVGTVTELLTRAVVGRITASPTNLAFGSRTTLLELIRKIEQELNVSLDVEFLPPRAGDVRESRADNQKLLELFGAVDAVSLEVGLHHTLAWMAGLQSA